MKKKEKRKRKKELWNTRAFDFLYEFSTAKQFIKELSPALLHRVPQAITRAHFILVDKKVRFVPNNADQ